MLFIKLIVYITGYLSGGISVLAFCISLIEYYKRREAHQLFMMVAWLFLSLWSIIATTSHIFISIELHALAFLFIMPMTFAIIFLSDSISRESLDVKKIAFASFASAIMIIFVFSPGAIVKYVWPTGETTLRTSGLFSISFAVLGVFMGLLLVYYMAKVFLNAPKSLKRYATFSFAGAILAGILMPIFSAIGLVHILIGSDFLLLTGGAFIMSLSFVKESRLAYVLPFKVERLLVFETSSGIPLYTHKWTKEASSIDEGLFSGMVQGVSMIVKESVQKGDIMEIKLSQAILIMERSEPIACVLVATKPSKTLRHALDRFAKRFFEEYSDKFDRYTNTWEFEGATKLVEEYFPFVPEYD